MFRVVNWNDVRCWWPLEKLSLTVRDDLPRCYIPAAKLLEIIVGGSGERKACAREPVKGVKYEEGAPMKSFVGGRTRSHLEGLKRFYDDGAVRPERIENGT